MEIRLNEIDVQKLDLKPGEVLVVTIRSDDIGQEDISRLSAGLKNIFSENKVVVLGVNSEGSITLTKVNPDGRFEENNSIPFWDEDLKGENNGN